jgi:transcriptional repressor NrdR
LDSRVVDGGQATRRRRECRVCRGRFTTFERIERTFAYVVKKDGRREPFDRAKVVSGMLRACKDRPVSWETLESVAAEIERGITESGAQVVSSRDIGDCVIEHLRHLDDVAYVRFASVFRRVEDVDHLVEEIQALKARKQLEAETRSQILLIPFVPQHLAKR